MTNTDRKTIKVYVLSSYTIQNIKQPLQDYLDRCGFAADVRFGGYNQIDQELRSPSSPLYAFQPDIVLIGTTARTFLGDVEHTIIDYETTLRESAEKVQLLLDSITACSLPAKILLTTFDKPAHSVYGYMDLVSEQGLSSLIAECNRQLLLYAREHSNVVLIDFEGVTAKIGKNDFTDEKMYYLGKLALSKRAADVFSHELAWCINAIYGNVKKVLVIDLDNTIWGGVIGEDGVHGIRLDESPVGSIYIDIQKVLLNYKKTGVLLALVSKNNVDDVLPVFTHNSNMILKQDDFAAIKINWEPKSRNIVQIAQQLNLGLESFVFLDDNPAERLEVASNLPQVTVIDFPHDIARVPALLKSLPYFRKVSLTQEDKQRSAMYADDQKRMLLQQSVSLDEYLQTLRIEISVHFNDTKQLERITQLINKTNQFNARTQRYTQERVSAMMHDPAYTVASVHVKDKFGDLGLTGVIITHKQPEGIFIDTFLLSCRVLSRGIEQQFFTEVAKHFSEHVFIAEYIASPKNVLIKDFFPTLGFTVVEQNDEKTVYVLNTAVKTLKNNNWIQVI